MVIAQEMLKLTITYMGLKINYSILDHSSIPQGSTRYDPGTPGHDPVHGIPIDLTDPFLDEAVGQEEDEAENEAGGIQAHGEVQQMGGVWKEEEEIEAS